MLGNRKINRGINIDALDLMKREKINGSSRIPRQTVVVLGVHVSFGEVERTVFPVPEGLLCELLAAWARHNLELCSRFGIRVPPPNNRADRDNPNQ